MRINPTAALRAAWLWLGLLSGCATTTTLKIHGPAAEPRAAHYEATLEFRR